LPDQRLRKKGHKLNKPNDEMQLFKVDGVTVHLEDRTKSGAAGAFLASFSSKK
jgi:hypothetical protein